MSVVTLLVVGFMFFGQSRVTAAAQSGPRVPVVVELFTSEGCSDCPPADALLLELQQKQPVSGVEIIPLELHVDYWNELGWPDRFSSAAMTARQQEYSRRFGLRSVYTPQMVVDGHDEFVGSDSRLALQKIAGAARGSKLNVALARDADGVQVEVSGTAGATGDVLLAITEDNLASSVGAGENRGRQLRHTAVVRDLRLLGNARDGHFSARPALKLNPEWRRQNLRAVVFVQQPNFGPILGAAALPLN
ncbi:MAG TPA: DUF1223 domain-containing protein [Terriglobales bacterium]|nr:DUF1223 domain-containing protein [Terriglobales bacterium]